MNLKVEKPEENIVVIEIEVEKDSFRQGIQKVYNKKRHAYHVPGFRKGKAPLSAIERVYGENVFLEDALNDVINKEYEKAVKETEIEPVAMPKIDIKQFDREKNLVFTAEVTVKPVAKVEEYKGIDVEKIAFVISDEDVDQEIKTVLERNVRITTVDGRAVQDGDIADIDFEGFIDDVAFPGGKGERYRLKIGSGSFIPGFEEQLIGKNIGDEFDITVTFPNDYHAKELAGKETVFKVKINALSISEYPELDDEFVKDISEFDTLDEYKASIRNKLRQQADSKEEEIYRSNVIKAVLAKTTINVPEVMVEDAMNRHMEDLERRLKGSGLTTEQYMNYIGYDIEAYKDQLRTSSLAHIRENILMETIVKLKNIEAGEERLAAELLKLAEQYNMDMDTLKSKLSDEGMADIKAQVNLMLAREFLIGQANAVVVEKPFTVYRLPIRPSTRS